jgi:hypothetical protein
VAEISIDVCIESTVDSVITSKKLYDPTPDIRHYDVYQQGATSAFPDKFSLAMADNPITERMYLEVNSTVDTPTTTYDYQVFYSRYLDIWKEELKYSVDNLKVYLTDEESEMLDAAQADWESSVWLNNELDSLMIVKFGMLLGSQHLYSRLTYLITQYSERAYHIKYMTYLIETHSGDAKIPIEDQLWDKFHDF